MTAPGRSHRAASPLAAALAALLIASPAALRLSGQTPVASAAVQTLQRDIYTLIASPGDAGTWGIVVRSLARDETLFETNPHKLLVPSSNVKIVTLAAAAERLGWDYTLVALLRRGLWLAACSTAT